MIWIAVSVVGLVIGAGALLLAFPPMDTVEMPGGETVFDHPPKRDGSEQREFY